MVLVGLALCSLASKAQKPSAGTDCRRPMLGLGDEHSANVRPGHDGHLTLVSVEYEMAADQGGPCTPDPVEPARGHSNGDPTT